MYKCIDLGTAKIFALALLNHRILSRIYANFEKPLELRINYFGVRLKLSIGLDRLQ